MALVLSNNGFGQNKLTYDQIDKLDRHSIIRFAKEEIDKYLILVGDSSFDYALIDTIRIFKNKKKYCVQFEQIIKYVPFNTVYYYGFYVDLLENNVSKMLIFNTDTIVNPIIFFHPNEQDREKINFVKTALSLGSINESIGILEKETYYEIGYGSSGEKLDKRSGETYDWWDRIEEVPDPEEMLIETKKE